MDSSLPNPNLSLFAPDTITDVTDRLAAIDADTCHCGTGPHLDALHDLANDDVPVLVFEIQRLHSVNTHLRAALDELTHHGDLTPAGRTKLEQILGGE